MEAVARELCAPLVQGARSACYRGLVTQTSAPGKRPRRGRNAHDPRVEARHKTCRVRWDGAVCGGAGRAVADPGIAAAGCCGAAVSAPVTPVPHLGSRALEAVAREQVRARRGEPSQNVGRKNNRCHVAAAGSVRSWLLLVSFKVRPAWPSKLMRSRRCTRVRGLYPTPSQHPRSRTPAPYTPPAPRGATSPTASGGGGLTYTSMASTEGST